jgi:Flp pilus assembly protein TadD
LLEQAVSIDPGFALAWAELARTEMFVPVSNPDLPVEPHVSRAREAVSRALAIDPELAMGHFAQGLIQESELDYAAAMESFATAHRQEPRNPFLAIRYGYYLALLGHSELGAELMEQGLRLDPTDAAGIGNLGSLQLAGGDLDEAERLLRRSYDLGFSPIGTILARLLAARGEQEEAFRVWREVGEEIPGRLLTEFDSPEGWDLLGQALLVEDQEDQEITARVVEAFADYFADPDARANTYRLYTLVQLGQPGEAMRLMLERPYPVNAGFVFSIWSDMNGFPEMRRHPEFPRFAEQIGLVEAWDLYGWPRRCRRLPRLSEEAPSFQCD